jgi:hypothetical protein
MPQFGSNPSVAAQNLSATQDPNGNPIISSENGFGASPLGVAARTQALYGIPNAHFDLTCADPNSAVEVNNAIPYWNLEYSGAIATTMVYDATTQNWSVRMDPTSADTGDYAVLKARTYLLNDDALGLRQKAFASLTRQGTTGTAQWSIVLSATYYDIAGTQLSTYNIGTAADTGTWTGINGITTSGSAAISTSAAYADIALTLTAAGSVSGTAKVDINSVLIATSSAATGSFLITQTFTSSGTWTRPTGVDYVTVVAMGGGGGGSGGNLRAQNDSTAVQTLGGDGGATGPWVILRDIYVGDASTVSIGIGAGGAGGTATTFNKAAAATGTATQSGGAGGAGGATTFGSYLSVGGGTATASAGLFGLVQSNGVRGGEGGYTPANSGINATDGLAHTMSSYTSAPYSVAWVSTGAAGSAGTGSGGSTSAVGTGGTANATLGIGGGGGGGGGASVDTGVNAGNGSAGGAAASGSGGGAVARRSAAASQTIVATGGAGVAAPTANKGAGGGGGGACVVGASSTSNYNSATLTMTSGAGAAGSGGWLTVAWVG